MIVMALGGLWHGAGWTFVIWGLVHGVLIGFNHLLRAWNKTAAQADKKSPSKRFFSRMLTFAAVTLAWVFFRSDDFGPALGMIESMLGFNGIDLPRAFGSSGQLDYFTFGGLFPNQVADIGLLFFLLFLLGLVWFSPNAMQLLKVRFDEGSRIELPSFAVLALCGFLLFFGIKVSFEAITYDFIYFRF
jgi:hypothetical protein